MFSGSCSLASAQRKRATSDILHRKSVKKEANDQWPSLAMSKTICSNRLRSKATFGITVSATSTRRARTPRLIFGATLPHYHFLRVRQLILRGIVFVHPVYKRISSFSFARCSSPSRGASLLSTKRSLFERFPWRQS